MRIPAVHHGAIHGTFGHEAGGGHKRSVESVSSDLKETVPAKRSRTEGPSFRAESIEAAGFGEVARLVGGGGGGDGFPWDEIRALSSPLLMHQMMQLCELLEGQGVELDAYPARECLCYCLEACRLAIDWENRGDPQPPLNLGQDWRIEAASRMVAQAIVLADEDAAILIDAVVGSSATGFLHALEFLFEAKVAQFRKGLEDLRNEAPQVRLHAEALYEDQALCRVAARLLVDRNGRLNIGLGSLLPELFRFSEKPRRAFLADMVERLEALKSDGELRSALEALDLPKGLRPRAEWLIRASVRKWKEEEPLQKADAVRAGLMALLSHLRQGYVGSCFMTSVGIQLTKWDPVRCVKDISALFSEGALTRVVDGEEWKFPLLLRFSKEKLNRELLLAADGTLIGEGIKIWEVAGIRAACEALDLEAEGMCKAILADKILRTDLQAFLKILASEADEGSGPFGRTPKELNVLAKYAFSAYTENPVLRAWEYAAASMVEARTTEVITAFDMDNTSLKGRAIHSIVEALTPRIATLSGDRIRLTQLLRGAITEELESRVQYVYDPHFEHHRTSLDGHSCLGAFVMYDRKRFSPSREVLAGSADTGKKVQRFLADCVSKACTSVKDHAYTKFLGFNLSRCRQNLIKFVKSDEFLVNSHAFFSYKNPEDESIVEKPQKVPHTYWVDQRGGDTRELELVYFGNQKWGPHQRLEPYTAQELLEKMAAWVRRQPPEYLSRLTEHSSWPLLSASPTHAFSVRPGNEEFRNLWTTERTPRQWIQENILPDARRIAQAPISLQEKRALAGAMVRLAPEGRRKDFERVLSSVPEGISRRDFRQLLLDYGGRYSICERALTRRQKRRFGGKGPTDLNSRAEQQWLKEMEDILPFVAESQQANFREEALQITRTLDSQQVHERWMRLLTRYGVRTLDLVEMEAKPEAEAENVPFNKELVALHLDQILYNHLPEVEKACIRRKALVVADTNWRAEATDIHFSIQINPGTGELVMWGCTEDGLRLMPKDQSSWFKGSYWPWTFWPRDAVLKV